MREETQAEPTCIYCNQPITTADWPYRGMPDGKKAHLACYIEHMCDDDKPEP